MSRWCADLQRLATIFLFLSMATLGSSEGAGAQENSLTLDNLRIEKRMLQVRIQVEPATRDGILEYLLVGTDGKEYESAFRVGKNLPSDLAFALLLIGLEPFPLHRFAEFQEEPNGGEELLRRFPQSIVRIECFRNGAAVDMGRFLKARESFDGRLLWLFTGGYFTDDNRYAGNRELNFIGIWPDPTAVVNLFSNLRNPYRGPYGLEIEPERAPWKEGDDIELIIRRGP